MTLEASGSRPHTSVAMQWQNRRRREERDTHELAKQPRRQQGQSIQTVAGYLLTLSRVKGLMPTAAHKREEDPEPRKRLPPASNNDATLHPPHGLGALISRLEAHQQVSCSFAACDFDEHAVDVTLALYKGRCHWGADDWLVVVQD